MYAFAPKGRNIGSVYYFGFDVFCLMWVIALYRCVVRTIVPALFCVPFRFLTRDMDIFHGVFRLFAWRLCATTLNGSSLFPFRSKHQQTLITV